MSFGPPPPGDLVDPLGRSGLDLSDLVIAVFSTALCVTLAFLGLVPLYNRVTGADAAKPAHAAAQAEPGARQLSRAGRPRELFPDEPAVEELAPPHATEAAEAVESTALLAEAEESAAEESATEEGAAEEGAAEEGAAEERAVAPADVAEEEEEEEPDAAPGATPDAEHEARARILAATRAAEDLLAKEAAKAAAKEAEEAAAKEAEKVAEAEAVEEAERAAQAEAEAEAAEAEAEKEAAEAAAAKEKVRLHCNSTASTALHARCTHAARTLHVHAGGGSP